MGCLALIQVEVGQLAVIAIAFVVTFLKEEAHIENWLFLALFLLHLWEFIDERTIFSYNKMPETAHKRLLSKIALLVIFSTTSIPLGLLQLGIWANMFEKFYNETQSFTLSAEWTLDGLNRCSGCELVDKLGSDSNEAISHLNTFSFETKLVYDPGPKIVVIILLIN